MRGTVLLPAGVDLVSSSLLVNQNRGEGFLLTIGSLAAWRRLWAHWLVVDSVSTALMACTL